MENFTVYELFSWIIFILFIILIIILFYQFIKKRSKIICFIFILVFGIFNYLFFTRDGSIKLGLIISNNNPMTKYENIDYENGNNYLNQIEIDDKIIYLECKNYGIIKLADYYSFGGN